MANIRDYLKEKEKRQKIDKGVNYKEKIRSHKLAIFYRIALTVALIIAAIVFFIMHGRN